MQGVASQGKQAEDASKRPDEAARKRVAVELIRDHDRPLRWTARRYSICSDDAEDAYQRGIEILLSKAPTTDLHHLLPWTRTVIKHEALAIRKTRERTLGRPGVVRDEDHEDEDWVQLIPATGAGPDEQTLRRERVARSREALAQLKPAELKALTQLAEGFSYDEIGTMNEWSRTKVNRCLSEGRARFRSAFRDSEAGECCAGFEPLLSACCDGELTRAQLKGLENHLAACGHCRATLRAYRAAPRAAAALAPLLPAGRSIWERFQEIFVDLQLRLQGVGRSSDAAVQGVVASGGSGGAGVAAIGKLAAICAGTAGTAAVCAATGVLPVADVLPDQKTQRPIERQAVKKANLDRTGPVAMFEPKVRADVEQQTESRERLRRNTRSRSNRQPEATGGGRSSGDSAPATQATAPVPTATESEFTPEAAGTPVTTPTPAAAPAPAPPPPPPAPPAQTSSVPVGNGGGEFAP